MTCGVPCAVGRNSPFLVLVALMIGWAEPSRAATRDLNFEDDVAPILEVRCLRCHGGEKTEAGLDLRRRFTIVAGGDSGAALVPGKPDESLLLEKVDAAEMPPGDEDPLDDKQIGVLRAWIAAGAPIKGEKELPLEVAETDDLVRDDERRFWAFVPPVQTAPPEVRHAERVRTPVDAFLLKKLEEHGLTYRPEAPRATLIRRLCFDLWGLPPTPEQIAAFETDSRPDAYERLVDELLDSPRYGERWGRHWLDLAGYAESDGYLDADRERPEAWRYRDYVIRSFNNDKPYDRFVLEQLAGDELSDWRRADELTPEWADQLIATGFLRTASDPTYVGYKEKPEIHKVLADTVQIVGSAFLGVTIQCARCHAHKSDPISQRDYYQLQAVLAAAYDPEPAKWLASGERGIPLATEAELARIEERNKLVDQRIAWLTAEKNRLETACRARLVDERLHVALEPIDESFDRIPPAPAWSVQLSGTARSWEREAAGGRLRVSAIEGGNGYAVVRLQRPVVLRSEFAAECRFAWTSADNGAESNTAMQVLLVVLRDFSGKTVAAAGYVDENNNMRGSPILAVDAAEDVIAANLAKYGAAVPLDEHARALAPSGTAQVTLRRDSAGAITVQFADGMREVTLQGTSAATVAQVEIELRRYVHPGATFEGLELDSLSVRSATETRYSDEERQAIRAALAGTLVPPAHQEFVAKNAPRIVIPESELAARFPEFDAESKRIAAAIQAETALKQQATVVRGLVDLPDPPESFVLRRGDFNQRGRKVQPGVPAVLAPPGYELKPIEGYKTTGRRKAFAEWLVEPAHPTTARLQVNRIWAGHFGRGIVETVDDFGQLGARPTHPELLDWLAVEFRKLHWSQKAVHRLIVCSSAYRQSSAYSAEAAEVDPENRLLWAFHPQRHTGEVVRDAVLAAAGKLNLEMGGPSVSLQAQPDGSIVVADSPAGNRRSVYLKVRRSQPITILDTFDTPRMEINCARRNEATVPTQALTMLNSPFVESASRALAQRVCAEAAGREGRIDRLSRLVYGRALSAVEQAAVERFLEQFVAAELGVQAETASPEQRAAAEEHAWQQVALTFLNSNEFLWVE